MAFVTCEDEHGVAETVWFPEVYLRCGPLIAEGRPCQVRGRVMVEFGVATMDVQQVLPVGPRIPST